MKVTATTYVHGAERMITAVRLARDGLYVRFADDREGMIPFADLGLARDPGWIVLPQPYVIELHLSNGHVEEVPWDFARHYVDRGYRDRSEHSGQLGRRLMGKSLKALRSDRGLTQSALADKSGINRVTIARLESGQQFPRYETVVALADALDVSVERLLVGGVRSCTITSLPRSVPPQSPGGSFPLNDDR